MDKYWYLVKVLPGKERKLTEEFNRQIDLNKIKNISRFVCPTEKFIVKVKDKKVIREKVLYSGYLYFECENLLNEDELKTISLTQNIMSMGTNKLPVLLSNSDVSRILKDDVLERHTDSKLLKYTVNETVKIIDGPFSSFDGVVVELKEDDHIDVDVKIFGRSTIISLLQNQISKL